MPTLDCFCSQRSDIEKSWGIGKVYTGSWRLRLLIHSTAAVYFEDVSPPDAKRVYCNNKKEAIRFANFNSLNDILDIMHSCYLRKKSKLLLLSLAFTKTLNA